MSAPVVPDWAYELGVAEVSLTGAARHLGQAKDASDEEARAALLKVALKNTERLAAHLRGLLGPAAPEAIAPDVTHGSQSTPPAEKATKGRSRANA